LPFITKCTIKPTFLALPTLSSADALGLTKALEDAKTGCVPFGLAVEQCLLGYDVCYKECESNIEVCKATLKLCLRVAVTLNIGLCGDKKVVEVALGLIAKVDFCTYYLNQQEAKCGNCVDLTKLISGFEIPAIAGADGLPALSGADELPALPGADGLPALP
jgi:hypothetical protein